MKTNSAEEYRLRLRLFRKYIDASDFVYLSKLQNRQNRKILELTKRLLVCMEKQQGILPSEIKREERVVNELSLSGENK